MSSPPTTTEGKTKFYRVDDIPETIRRRFDAAILEVRRLAEIEGKPHVPFANAFVGLVAGADVDEMIAAGKKAARGFAEEERVDRHYQLPPAVKAEIDVAAESNGINIGAFGRLLLTGVAAGDSEEEAVARLVETIRRGMVLRYGGEVEAPVVAEVEA